MNVYQAWKEFPNTTKPLFQAIPGYDYNVAIDVKKNNTVLLNNINKFIVFSQQQGIVQTLAEQYIGDLNKAILQQGGTLFFTFSSPVAPRTIPN